MRFSKLVWISREVLCRGRGWCRSNWSESCRRLHDTEFTLSETVTDALVAVRLLSLFQLLEEPKLANDCWMGKGVHVIWDISYRVEISTSIMHTISQYIFITKGKTKGMMQFSRNVTDIGKITEGHIICRSTCCRNLDGIQKPGRPNIPPSLFGSQRYMSPQRQYCKQRQT